MPSVAVFYHYFHPDDVVSAQHLTDLCVGLHQRGWEVTALPSNRGCRNEDTVYGQRDEHQGVSIRRIWRPNFRQSSGSGRILNAAWMITSWGLRSLTTKADVLVIGTDPILSVLTASVWRTFSPKTRIAHWCFDLYPEAAIADGLLKPGALLRLLTALVGNSYRRCDLIADLGPCMRAVLTGYGHHARVATLTPWALQEPQRVVPQEQNERQELFGDSKLGLLYSGSFGRAHIFEPFLALARAGRHLPIQMTFSVRGNREASLRAAIRPDDANIRIVPFASPDRLEARLAAADIHLVSLHEDWTGAVVPSKFFGALAVGRPVLFAGSPESSIAQFIHQHQVGWVLSNDNLKEVLSDFEALIADPARLQRLSSHCHDVYQRNFSKKQMCDAWDHHLRALLGEPIVEPPS